MAREICLPFFLTGHKFRPLDFSDHGICIRLFCVSCGRTVLTSASDTVAGYTVGVEGDGSDPMELPPIEPTRHN